VIRCEVTACIRRDPAQVFALLADLERVPRWLDRCVWIAQTSDGARGPGTQLRYRYRDRGHEGEIAGALEAYEPHRRIAMTFIDKALDARVVFELVPHRDGTQLTHRAEITPKLLVVKLLSPWIRRSVRRQMAEAVDRLRRLVES
jgi:uncharacterized protein YndB with AHSA1/START domain